MTILIQIADFFEKLVSCWVSCGSHCYNNFYENSHPQSQDIFLLIEVADISIDYNREVKIPLYANSNIYEVWLIDINAQLITVYRYPQNEHYQEIKTYHRGENISIISFPNIYLQVNDILG